MVLKKGKIENFKEKKIYQVFIDRYAGCLPVEQCSINNLKCNFIGGNLIDLMNKIDYIKSLKFEIIWLTPFYVNQPKGYHGYHVINYNHVDPRFAFGKRKLNEEQIRIGNPLNDDDIDLETEADKVLRKFVEECKKRDMKVMMDFVPNHCHEKHPFFQKALNNENNYRYNYRDLFYFIGEEPNQRYLKFLDVDELPKLNLNNPYVRNHLIKSTNKFLSYGIDAVRIDHCIGPHINDLGAIIEEIRKSHPDVIFIGEILPFGCQKAADTVLGLEKNELKRFNGNTFDALDFMDEIFLNYYYDILDGVLDFYFHYTVDKFVCGIITENECKQNLITHYNRYKDKDDFLLLKNVDSHDSDRIMFRCHDNVKLLQKVLKLLYRDFNERKDPLVIYYGTEDLMSQEDTIHSGEYGDYRCRMPMKFIYENFKSINQFFD